MGYKSEFKKHYRRAMQLKEGGAAWEREINLARKYLALGKAEYDRKLEERYGY